MDPDKKYKLIEDYLLGLLHGKQLDNFENKLKSDIAFAAEVDLHRSLFDHFDEKSTHTVKIDKSDEALHQFLQSDEAHSFKQKLKSIKENPETVVTKKKRETPVRKLNWKVWVAAASVALLAGLFYFTNQDSTVNALALFDQYGKHDPLALVEKGTTEAALFEIQDAYNAKDYAKANNLIDRSLKTLTTEDTEWFSLNLTKGISLMELGESNKAIAIFKVLEAGDFIDAPKASWNLILAYLKMEDLENASIQIKKHKKAGYKYKMIDLKEIQSKLGE